MNGEFASTAAVVRSYNNPYVAERVSSLCKMGLGRIIVVTDAEKDRGKTREVLKPLLSKRDVQLIEFRERHFWSGALNRALTVIKQENEKRRKKGGGVFRFVLNISVEALLEWVHLEAMLNEAASAPNIAIIGTTFSALGNDKPVALGRSYRHPRNTCLLLCLEVLGASFGGFDSRCDTIGGMEDLDLCLRIAASGTFAVKMLPLSVPLIIGRHQNQQEKEAQEQAAMDKIIARRRSFFAEGTSERQRIEKFIAELQLESH